MRDDAVYIEKVEVKNYLFFDDFSLDFCKSDVKVNQWTVLLGNNNTGKTSLLRALSRVRDITPTNPNNNKANLGDYLDNHFYYMKGDYLNDYSVSFSLSNFRSEIHRIKDNCYSISRSSSVLDISIYGYGVSRYPSQNKLSEFFGESCDSLMSIDQRLLNLEEWILKIETSKNSGNVQAQRQYPILHSVICESKLFPDIKSFKVETDEKYNFSVLFETASGWVNYSQLPSGYQTMLSWVADFCYRMFVRYKDSENPLHEPAIVLIDEIDLNLHPEWQRKIVPLLSEAFPNTQFIATTHSPFVIQSMEDVNLYVLSRDENGKGVITRVPGNNFTGWSVEEILTDIMGLDERINSDKYNELMAKFDDGLDNDDKQKVEEAYSALCAILPPNSKTRKIIDYQKKKVC